MTSIAKENEGNVIQRDDVSASSEWVVIFKELRRCRHEWNAVRPQGDNMAVAKDGMPFIKAIQRYLAELRTMLDGLDTTDSADSCDKLLREAMDIQRMHFPLDGGRSLRLFWERGDALMENAMMLIQDIQTVLQES